jgi:hypothetical protein
VVVSHVKLVERSAEREGRKASFRSLDAMEW